MAEKCFVSIPYGRKVDSSGREIDFDKIYRDLIVPAVSQAGFEATILFDYFSNAPVLDVIVKCVADPPLFIADVTTRNPNVLYELGIRHAFVPTGTIVLREAAEMIPFNLTNIFVHTYQIAEDYSLERQRLTENIGKIVADKVPNLVYRKARYARDFDE
jgi:hypothetical protein